MARGPNPIKVQEWTERLARFRKSKLSVAQFCDAEGVSTPSFYHWQRKLRKLASPGSKSDSTTSPTNRRPAFQTVQVTSSGPLAAPQPALTVYLPGGIQVHVADNLPAIGAVMRGLARHLENNADDHTDSGASTC
jgi:hypothetical protein